MNPDIIGPADDERLTKEVMPGTGGPQPVETLPGGSGLSGVDPSVLPQFRQVQGDLDLEIKLNLALRELAANGARILEVYFIPPTSNQYRVHEAWIRYETDRDDLQLALAELQAAIASARANRPHP